VPQSVPPEDDAKFIAYFREGLSAVDIARVEQMSIHTVKSRISRLYQRYGAHTRGQLLALYADEQHSNEVRNGLITEQLSKELTEWLGTRGRDDSVADALQVAFDVRFAPPTQMRLRLNRLVDSDRDRLLSLVLTLAALVQLDRSPDVNLRWLLDRQRRPQRRPARDRTVERR
jgi:hypothetical protein